MPQTQIGNAIIQKDGETTKAEQTEAQRLNAAKPTLTRQAASAFDPLVTPNVQRIIDANPNGEDIYRNLARRHRTERQEFRIHHLDDGSSLVVRSFNYGNYAVIMTEDESLNHYGAHQQIAEKQKTSTPQRQCWLGHSPVRIQHRMGHIPDRARHRHHATLPPRIPGRHQVKTTATPATSIPTPT